MFWGKNLKSNETYPLDSDKTILGSNLNITNISLSDALDNVKYYIKITDNNQTYQICSLEKSKDSISTSLTFKVQKGIKLSVKGGNRGTISFVGFAEVFQESPMEEINTDKEKDKVSKIKENKEKIEVVPELKKERKESEERKEIKDKKGKEEELEEDEDSEEGNKLGKFDDDDDEDDFDYEMKEDEEEEEEEEEDDLEEKE